MFAFVVCALLCCVGLFLPAGRLTVAAGSPAEQERSISLWTLGGSKDSVRRFIDGFKGSSAKQLGKVVLGKVAPRLKGRLGSQATDVHDAMVALDEVRDEDVETVGTAAAITVWSLLGLNLLIAGLLIKTDPQTGRGRWRVFVALALALVLAAAGVATHLVLRTVVAAGNDELGYPMLSLRAGAYLIPIAAIAGTVAVIALLVAFVRRR